MVLNWLWNLKYSKTHVRSTIVLQKYTRGFLARRRVDKMLEDLETKQQVMLVWHSIMKQSKQIKALSDETKIDFETKLDTAPEYHHVVRTYMKQRSNMVRNILDLDEYVNQLNNVGDPLPSRMFPIHGLFIQGRQIISPI
jgi:hypothetical protein